MPLDLANLAPTIGAKMPETKRGRDAVPVPKSIVDAVKKTKTLPEGQGGSFAVPNGEKNEAGKDKNILLVVGQLRKAATQLGYGISVKVMEPKAKTTEVLFRAKDKSARTRRTKEQIAHDNAVAEWSAWFTDNEVTELPERDAVGDDDAPVYADDADYDAAVEAFDALAPDDESE